MGNNFTEVSGASLRLRVENQLGYKMVKWIERIEIIASEKSVGFREGGINEDDDEYFDLLPTNLGTLDNGHHDSHIEQNGAEYV